VAEFQDFRSARYSARHGAAPSRACLCSARTMGCIETLAAGPSASGARNADLRVLYIPSGAP
jgi:hypothetical protein